MGKCLEELSGVRVLIAI